MAGLRVDCVLDCSQAGQAARRAAVGQQRPQEHGLQPCRTWRPKPVYARRGADDVVEYAHGNLAQSGETQMDVH